MLLVTDDRSSDSLLEEGHMNFVVRHAISQGVKPVTAFQMATINAAERFGVARDVGTLTPGSCADIILLDGNLADVHVTMTIAAGQVVAENGHMVVDWPAYNYPEEVLHSVHLARTVREEDFIIAAPIESGFLDTRVIQVRENHVETEELIRSIPVAQHQLQVSESVGLCKIAVIERHLGSGNQSVGVVANIGFKQPAAIAMTVAHDSHNILIIGNDDQLMAQAANKVAAMHGGVAFVTEQEVTLIPLQIAGLMSTAPFETVAKETQALNRALYNAGCTLNYALMTLSLLALVVIPTLRISDKGLVRISQDGIRLVSLYLSSERERDLQSNHI
jgi:adenine deaminase